VIEATSGVSQSLSVSDMNGVHCSSCYKFQEGESNNIIIKGMVIVNILMEESVLLFHDAEVCSISISFPL
jgi:hypothetical protein